MRPSEWLRVIPKSLKVRPPLWIGVIEFRRGGDSCPMSPHRSPERESTTLPYGTMVVPSKFNRHQNLHKTIRSSLVHSCFCLKKILVGYVVPILLRHLLWLRMPLPGVGCAFVLVARRYWNYKRWARLSISHPSRRLKQKDSLDFLKSPSRRLQITKPVF